MLARYHFSACSNYEETACLYSLSHGPGVLFVSRLGWFAFASVILISAFLISRESAEITACVPHDCLAI